MIEELYRQYHAELVGWCSSMTDNPQTAEELVQEAFLRAILHEALLHQLAANQRRAWLYRTVKNLYLDQLRHLKGEVLSQPPEQSGQNDFHAVEWELLLNQLPELEGVIFSMRYLQGYRSHEIGQILCLPAGTVRCKLSNARKHVQKLLGGLDDVN